MTSQPQSLAVPLAKTHGRTLALAACLECGPPQIESAPALEKPRAPTCRHRDKAPASAPAPRHRQSGWEAVGIGIPLNPAASPEQGRCNPEGRHIQMPAHRLARLMAA